MQKYARQSVQICQLSMRRDAVGMRFLGQKPVALICPVFVWCSAFGPKIGLTHVSLLGVFPWRFFCGKGFTPILSPSFYEIRAACSDNRPVSTPGLGRKTHTTPGWKVQWASPKSWGFRQKWGELFTSGEIYPLVICQIANWKMTIEIVDFPIENGDFP